MPRDTLARTSTAPFPPLILSMIPFLSECLDRDQVRFFLASNSWVYLSRAKSRSKAAAMPRCNRLDLFHKCRLLGKRESATPPTQECSPAWVVPSQCYLLLFLILFISYAFISCVFMVTNLSSFKMCLIKGVCMVNLDG